MNSNNTPVLYSPEGRPLRPDTNQRLGNLENAVGSMQQGLRSAFNALQQNMMIHANEINQMGQAISQLMLQNKVLTELLLETNTVTEEALTSHMESAVAEFNQRLKDEAERLKVEADRDADETDDMEPDDDNDDESELVENIEIA